MVDPTKDDNLGNSGQRKETAEQGNETREGIIASQPEEELEALRARVRELELEVEEARKAYLYERAELENFKKRVQREQTELLRYATEPLVRDLLPVVDNLERALQHAKAGEQSIIQGVELTLRMFLDTLQRHGVSRVEAMGEVFDPARHEAVAHLASEEHDANRVIEQHQVGYMLHDRLVRPALVSVSRGRTNSGANGSAVAGAGDSD
ncbi:MAG: nucleotide exchange factor GrpE [Candidatus Binatia bacterium]|nr:nucleotide exchange factor GrpE [Candidatus Binatia bacterium]